MPNPLITTPTDDFEIEGRFSSEAESVGDLDSKKDFISSKDNTSEFYNSELRIFQIEERLKDLEKRMIPIMDNILSQLKIYNILIDEKKILFKQLSKAKGHQIDRLIPARDEE